MRLNCLRGHIREVFLQRNIMHVDKSCPTKVNLTSYERIELVVSYKIDDETCYCMLFKILYNVLS